jgi:hypothetical protein
VPWPTRRRGGNRKDDAQTSLKNWAWAAMTPLHHLSLSMSRPEHAYNIGARFHGQLAGTSCGLSFLQLMRPICLCFSAEAIFLLIIIFTEDRTLCFFELKLFAGVIIGK